MKLPFILLLLISVGLKGQTQVDKWGNKWEIQNVDLTFNNDSSITIESGTGKIKYQPHYDTVKCIILCTEDSAWKRIAFSIRGYEVRERVDLPVFSWDDKSVPEYYIRAYLDADKKPLKYFVWMSKQLP